MSLLSEFLYEFAQKNGWGTLVTAAFGAFTGGWIASRAFTKRAVVAELNALSAAQTLCFAICNRYIGLKRQLVLPMKQRFGQVQSDHKKFLNMPKATRGAFMFDADFQTITPVTTPAEALQRMIFEKTSIRGRALAAVVDLVGVIESLRLAIESRTQLSSEIRNKKDKTDADLAAMYLGLKTSDGHIDERYRTTVEALYLQTDDCIFFSRTLASDLGTYGNSLRRRYLWRYWLWLPKMQDADWSMAEASGLIPPDSQYDTWLRGFRTLSNWQRFKARITP
jgi:hypothetical protein